MALIMSSSWLARKMTSNIFPVPLRIPLNNFVNHHWTTPTIIEPLREFLNDFDIINPLWLRIWTLLHCRSETWNFDLRIALKILCKTTKQLGRSLNDYESHLSLQNSLTVSRSLNHFEIHFMNHWTTLRVTLKLLRRPFRTLVWESLNVFETEPLWKSMNHFENCVMNHWTVSRTSNRLRISLYCFTKSKSTPSSYYTSFKIRIEFKNTLDLGFRLDSKN